MQNVGIVCIEALGKVVFFGVFFGGPLRTFSTPKGNFVLTIRHIFRTFLCFPSVFLHVSFYRARCFARLDPIEERET